MSSAAKIAVIYSSTWGHVRTLAEKVAEGAKSTGATVDIFQFPEILPAEVLQKMHAAPRAEYPDISAEKMKEYDGFLMGIPTRYGRAVGSASAFFDTTGGLWASGALASKMCGIFTSTASQHGGQETTALTTIPFIAHHGMIYVPMGFGHPALSDNSKVVGGSAYGAAAVANGDGSRAVSDEELSISEMQGTNFAKTVNQFVAGKAKLAEKPAEEAAPAKAVPQEAAGYEVKEGESKPSEGGESSSKPAEAPKAAEHPSGSKPEASQQQKKQEQLKKKGGIFASCCGGSDKNYDS